VRIAFLHYDAELDDKTRTAMPHISDHNFWDQRRGKIFSRKGGWRMGESIIHSHGYSMMDDLVGEHSYFQVLILNAVGRLPERRVADWLEAAFICLSWPDPRIWCNQIGALGGSNKSSVVAATVAGVLAADSTMYGSRPLLEGVSFIQQALRDKKEQGLSAQEIVAREVAKHRGKVNIVGYARPFAFGDERVFAMERVTRELGFEIGEHLKLANEIRDVLFEEYGESININGYASAFMSDHGYSPEEIYRICSICVVSGVTACHVDAEGRAPDSFLPLRCEDIQYEGKAPRQVPAK
jgi:citrate synthase